MDMEELDRDCIVAAARTSIYSKVSDSAFIKIISFLVDILFNMMIDVQ